MLATQASLVLAYTGVLKSLYAVDMRDCGVWNDVIRVAHRVDLMKMNYQSARDILVN